MKSIIDPSDAPSMEKSALLITKSAVGAHGVSKIACQPSSHPEDTVSVFTGGFMACVSALAKAASSDVSE